MNSKFFKALEQILDLESGFVNGDTVFKDLPEWDSLAALGVMVAIEEQYQKVVDPSIFKNCTTIDQLLAEVDKV